MSAVTYSWKRFWCPRTGTLNLSDDGYLYDPETSWGNAVNPHVVSYESVSNTKCLILLGEPGMGKTNALQFARKISEEKNLTMYIDLRSCGSELGLFRILFENPTFVHWKESNSTLHLFLDSLDECLLRIDYLSALLAEEFKKYPLERLYLRVACRTADWPTNLENELTILWGEENVRIYELAPLRKKDVAAAIKQNGIPEAEFFKVVKEKAAVPFAIKPVTLTFLMNLFKRNGNLPPTQRELYFEGCRLLCEETNVNRIQLIQKGITTTQERLTIASRIAAITVFSNKYAVFTGLDLGDTNEEDATILELTYGKQRQYEKDLIINEKQIFETLSTGLFTSRGVNRLGWAHQTYAEFLAAMYIIENNFSMHQILNLIVHPDDPDGRVVPQLNEVTSWVATMNKEVFDQILTRDPEILLRSDVATVDNQDKEALVMGLLQKYDEEKIIDWDYKNHSNYNKLNHPKLASQLTPFIMDNSKNIFVRRVAISIARECRLTELQHDLLTLALNPAEEYQVRKNAVYALADIADGEVKVKLIPLVRSELGEDTDDDLKGASLQALWPELISSSDVISVITNPKRENYLGSYRSFLSFQFLDGFRISDLPAALEWVKAQAPLHRLKSTFAELVKGIVKKVWDNLYHEDLGNQLARTLLSRKGYHDRFDLIEANNQDDEKRRFFITSFVGLEECNIDDVRELLYSQFLRAYDFNWVIQQLLVSKTTFIEEKWAEILKYLFDANDPIQVQTLYNTSMENAVVYNSVKQFFEPIIIESEEAKELKEIYELKRKRLRRDEKMIMLVEKVKKRRAELFEELRSGRLDAWWELCDVLTYCSDGTKSSELESDLTKLEAWDLLSPSERTDMLIYAKKYVLEQAADNEKWLGQNVIFRPAFSGFKAFCLILHQDPTFLETLPGDVWRNWASLILSYPVTNDIVRNRLVNMAYIHASEEIIDTLSVLIDKENSESSYIFITRAVEECWDSRIEELVVSKMKSQDIKPKCMGILLQQLLKRGNIEAKAYAWSLIEHRYTDDGDNRERAIIAACELVRLADSTEWETIWSKLNDDISFVRQLIYGMADRSNNLFSKLTEKQLAKLYIWLVQQFPYSEDPKYDDEEMAHSVTPREEVGNFRDSIWRILKQKGTHEAVTELEYIASTYPDIQWLKWSILEAKELTRRYTWVPASPDHIIHLTSSNQRRLVQNGQQLLDLIIESLERLELRLHGETPEVRWLWNDLGHKKYKPRSENELSDYIKQHLEKDLIERGLIVNREVEIRASFGSVKGERTDIEVETISESWGPVSVIIEVKGNWNDEVETALETQLVNRYLRKNSSKFGLYLVGWFESSAWIEEDHRKRKIPKKIGIENFRDYLKTQAQALTRDGIYVKSFVLDLRI